jgi:hypothetical protein
MNNPGSRRWWRDVLVGGLASLLTAVVFVPYAWASHCKLEEEAEAARQEAQTAAQRAEEKAAEAEQQRDLAHRAMLERAADFAGFGDKSAAEAMRVMTAAVSPEVPKDAWLLIDKKASAYVAGDIVIFRDSGNNYLGRVVAVDKAAGRVTVGRNGEENRVIAVAQLAGRGVLNTR